MGPQPTKPESDSEDDRSTARRPGLQSLRAILIFLLLLVVLTAGLGLFATSPWTRASPDCSVWCVIGEHIEALF